MPNYAPVRTTYNTVDRRWIVDITKLLTRGITLNGDLFPAGLIPSGTQIALVTSTNLGAPFGGTSEEVQTVTVGGSGLTSFTLTFAGQTTAAIAAAATAAQVQTALEALSTIGVGNVAVTGSAGGPWTVTFQGDLANTDVAQMTATPTGGTGTVTVTTTTAGGAATDTPAGTGTCVGYLVNDTVVAAAGRYHVAVANGGPVKHQFLPPTHDPAGEADLPAITRA